MFSRLFLNIPAHGGFRPLTISCPYMPLPTKQQQHTTDSQDHKN